MLSIQHSVSARLRIGRIKVLNTGREFCTRDWIGEGGQHRWTTVFDSSAFASSLKLARSDVSGVLSVAEATFDLHIDATTVTVGGEISVAGLTVDGAIDFVGTHVDGDTDLRKLSVVDDAEWDHTSIGGELLASDCSTSGGAGFDNVQVRGGTCVFDGE